MASPIKKHTSPFDLTGRTVFLSGASGHLGREIARGLWEAGAHVILNGRNAARLEVLAATLKGRAGASVAAFDLADESAMKKEVRLLGQHFGQLSGLVCAAHDASVGGHASEAEAFARTYEIAVTGPHGLTTALLPLLKKGAKHVPGGASVVYFSSMYGWVSPNPSVYAPEQAKNPPFYGPAKAGVHQLARYQACHLAPYNIRVNTVSPGPFPPPAALQAQPGFAKRLKEKVPLGRIGSPTEVAGPVVFLLSSAASYMTGANLAVDGGWTAW